MCPYLYDILVFNIHTDLSLIGFYPPNFILLSFLIPSSPCSVILYNTMDFFFEKFYPSKIQAGCFSLVLFSWTESVLSYASSFFSIWMYSSFFRSFLFTCIVCVYGIILSVYYVQSLYYKQYAKHIYIYIAMSNWSMIVFVINNIFIHRHK